jgi:hypothetical protein
MIVMHLHPHLESLALTNSTPLDGAREQMP